MEKILDDVRLERSTGVTALFCLLIESAVLCRVEPLAYLLEAMPRAGQNSSAVTLARDSKASES